MKKHTIILYVVIAVAIASGVYWYLNTSSSGLKTITLSMEQGGPSITMEVEVADSEEERDRGLMLRQTLDPKSGMFFIFEEQAPRSFWMKNTLIPLDILYFAADGSFVSRTTMQPCIEDPCPQYPSAGEAKYALEVVANSPHVKSVGPAWKVSY